MIYEATFAYDTIDAKGKEKRVKESVIIGNAELFSEVESTVLEYSTYDNTDVTSIKRSAIKEIANTGNDDDIIFKATVADIFTDDNGKEKETNYQIAFFAHDIAHAQKFIEEYLKQGYDMRLKEIKETKFSTVL